MSIKECLLFLGFIMAITGAQMAQGRTIEQKESAYLDAMTAMEIADQPMDEAPTILAQGKGDAKPVVVSEPWKGPAHLNRVGTPILACVAIKWSDSSYMTAAKCLGVAQKVSAFYSKQSRGLFKMTPQGKEITTALPCKHGNLADAEAQVKRDVRAYKYIVPVVCPAHQGTHASNDIAHTSQLTTIWNSHEVGHLIGLGHSNLYKKDDKGVYRYVQYADHESLMGGGLPKSDLTPMQRYHLGWIPQSEVAIFDPAISEYELKSSNDTKTVAKSILFIPYGLLPGTTGPVFAITASDYCGAAPCGRYYQHAGGSSLLRAGFGSDGFKDEKTGLKMSVISKANGITKFKVTLEPVTLKVDVE